MRPTQKREIHAAFPDQLNCGHRNSRCLDTDRALLHLNNLINRLNESRRAIDMKTVAPHRAEKESLHSKTNAAHCGKCNQKLVPKRPPITCRSTWKRSGATKITGAQCGTVGTNRVMLYAQQ